MFHNDEILCNFAGFFSPNIDVIVNARKYKLFTLLFVNMLSTVPEAIRGSATITVQFRMRLLFLLCFSVTKELNVVVIMEEVARTQDLSDFSFVVFLSVRPSVLMEQLGIHSTDFHLIFEYFSKLCRGSIKFHQNLTIITVALHEDLRIFMKTSQCIFLGMTNVSDICCREKQNTFHVQ